jgi:hypothetical protein
MLAWAFRFKVPDWREFSDPNIGWLIFFVPPLVIGSVAATVIGRIIHAIRDRAHPDPKATSTSRTDDATPSIDEALARRKRGLRMVGVALLVELGRYVYLLRDPALGAFYVAVLAASLVGGLLFGWGCLLYARSKGLSPWWALLGVTWTFGGLVFRALSLLFFIYLVSTADRMARTVTAPAQNDT